MNLFVVLLLCSDPVSTMSFFFLRFVVFAFGSGVEVSAQVPDYETTPFPLALTSFTCHGRPPGYYADIKTGCKTYHVCDGNSHFTYICPRRTLFQQRSRTCDHSYLVRCQDSPHFFEGAHLHPDEEEEEDALRLATTSEESQPTEVDTVDGTGKTSPGSVNISLAFAPEQEGIYGPTERTQFASEESEESIPTVVTTPPGTETTTTTKPFQSSSLEFSTVNDQPSSKEDYASQSTKKFLKVRLKDLRSLFFIPEFHNNSLVAKSEREFILPLEKSNFVRFKTRKEVSGLSSLCPTYCDPKYFLPGICHPCLMIK